MSVLKTSVSTSSADEVKLPASLMLPTPSPTEHAAANISLTVRPFHPELPPDPVLTLIEFMVVVPVMFTVLNAAGIEMVPALAMLSLSSVSMPSN